MEEQAIDEAPGLLEVARRQTLLEELSVWGGGSGATDIGEEAERRPGTDAEGHPLRGSNHGVRWRVPARQSIGHHVKAVGLILDGEVDAKELADPLMLRHRRQTLVQQELEAVVIGADPERPAPKIWPPVVHRLDQADDLLLVRRKLKVAGGERVTEEGEWPLVPMKDRPKPHTGGVAVNNKWAVESRHLQDGTHREGVFQGLEHCCGLNIPCEGVAAEQPHQRGRDEAKFPDEFPVVAHEPQEPTEGPQLVWYRSFLDSGHLVRIHRYTLGRDDMVKVGDRRRPKRALRALKMKTVHSKLVKDDGDVLEMLGP